MNRRQLLKAMAHLPILGTLLAAPVSWSAVPRALSTKSRIRPKDAGWPDGEAWRGLHDSVGGRLHKVASPFDNCTATPVGAACQEAMTYLKSRNPFYVGDQPGLTETSGWIDAWTSQPSAYVVAAERTADVVAAVNFAREKNLRLVIKGGGHSYQGTSNAPDSLLVWTHHMNSVALHDGFVPQGCAGTMAPQPAVSLGAGALWIDAYTAVTTHGGRYVQGGGCTTVGVVGLLQGGGFSNFSKRYGTAAAALLEAEVVTADGQVRLANAATNSDLFWALKGGGGGSFGVITRVTLRTRELPETFGAAFGKIKASSDEAYRALLAKVVSFYQEALFNPHWGEQLSFGYGNKVGISMVFQGLTEQQAKATWQPFLDWVNARPEYTFTEPFKTLAIPAHHFWNPEMVNQGVPGIMVADGRPDTSAQHVVWAGDRDQVGWFITGYQSAWLPASLLAKDEQARLVDAIFACTREWSVGFHFNKGLAGAPAAEVEAARNTATNPEVLDAFALAIVAGGNDPAYPGLPGKGPDLDSARDDAQAINKAMAALLKAAPGAGSYVSEGDYFRTDWQQAFWGVNYPRLAITKQKYDPNGLFIVHHGVGSEGWSADGFTRLDT